MKKEEFDKIEYWFLISVAIDYISLDEIVKKVSKIFEIEPTKKNFSKAIIFIKYLFSKYGNYIHYTLGPGEPINKNFDEFIIWLNEIYDAGRYKEIDYGVWFDLDKKVIPKKYIPKL